MNRKNFFALLAFVLLFSLALSACGKSTQVGVPVPTATDWVPVFGQAENSDDIVLTPGGPSYAGNTVSANVSHPLTPVDITQVTLSQGSVFAYVSYRAEIETKKPAIRNDIINVFVMGKDISTTQPANAVQGLVIYLLDLPAGVAVTEGMQISSPLSTSSVLVFDISEEAKVGTHKFQIDLKINGVDFGTLSCTLKVTD
jgi:hypothetical protein